MGVNIQQATFDNLPKISELYHGRKSIEELRWLFSNPDNHDELNAYVGIDDKNNVVAVVGYSMCTYYFQGKNAEGVIPFSWFVAPKYRGLLGITLLKKAFDRGDFLITIDGSKEAQALYSAFALKFIGKAYTYMKLLRPIAYVRSLKKNPIWGILHTIRILPSFLRGNGIAQSSEFELILSKDYPDIVEYGSAMRKIITQNYFYWLISCPHLESFAFHIKKAGVNVGLAVCYMAKTNRNILRGRIVHLSDLGNEKDFALVIGKIITFLKLKGCTSVSILANIESLNKALSKTLNFSKILSKTKPYYIRDNKEVFSVNAYRNWHIQYSEGDKAYRDI